MDLTARPSGDDRGEGASYVRCAGIKKGGERCKLEATHGSYCWSHAPDTAEDRKQRASRAGRAGGNGRSGGASAASKEISVLKGRLEKLVARILDGSVTRGDASAVIQAWNLTARLIGLEREILETEELERRIAALEQASRNGKGGKLWAG